MPAQELTPLPLAEGISPPVDSVRQALDSFQGVQSHALRWVLRVLPWLMMLMAVAILGRLRDPMYASGLFFAALSLFALQLLMQRIPDTFGTLWDRRIIATKDTTGLGDTSPTEEALNSTDNSLTPNPLEEQYRRSIRDFEGWLNHSPGQLALGLVFTALDSVQYPYRSWAEGRSLIECLGGRYYSWGGVLGELFIGFIIGVMVWRMFITGVHVSQLGKKFNLSPQPRHRDRSGGLEPLGYLCLWNALIVSIPGVWLGSWIILASRMPQYQFWRSLHTGLLVVPIALAGVTFFLPLWSVHQIMVAKRTAVRRQLDQLRQRIDQLATEMLDGADKLEQEEVEKMAAELKLMSHIYQQNEPYPVWPFNVGIMTRLATPQVVPLLGLTGLGEPILKVIDSMMGSLADILQIQSSI